MLELFVILMIWFIVLGFSNFLSVKYKFFYYKNPLLFGSWFIIWSFILIFFYQNYFDETYFFKQIYLWFLLLGVVLFFVKSVTFYYLRVKVRKVESTYDTFSKFTEITFQQISIFLLWRFFSVIYGTGLLSIVYFALFFSLIHVPLFLILKKRDAGIFVVSSLFGGLLFSFILSNFYYGVYVTFSVHVVFYVLLDLVFIRFSLNPVYKEMPKL